MFDRYDITSEEDLTEAARKLEALTGTVAGTRAITDAEMLKNRLSNFSERKVNGGEGQNRTVDTTIFSLYFGPFHGFPVDFIWPVFR
jgi:hypothetical protein